MAGLPGAAREKMEAAGIGSTDARGLDVGDPFVMMVSTGPGWYTLGLFSCTVGPTEDTRTGSGPVINGRLMKLTRSRCVLSAGEGVSSAGVTPATNSSPVGDWWDHHGELGMHKGELSCKSRLIMPLDPDVVVEPVATKEVGARQVVGAGVTAEEMVEEQTIVERTCFRFRLDDLVALKSTLVEQLGAMKAWDQLPRHKVASADINPLPLHEDLLHVEASTVGVAVGTAVEKIGCKLCLKQLSRSKMRMHIGGHILKDKVRLA